MSLQCQSYFKCELRIIHENNGPLICLGSAYFKPDCCFLSYYTLRYKGKFIFRVKEKMSLLVQKRWNYVANELWTISLHGVTWISKCIHYKVCDEITYPFPKFNGITIELWKWISNFITHMTGPVFDFYAGPSARGRQLYCRACNFKSVSALWAGNFYTCHVEPNGVPLSMDATRFYSKDIHLVMIQTNTRQRCVPS